MTLRCSGKSGTFKWRALGLLVAGALTIAAIHRSGHLLHSMVGALVLLGGIARYWRPHLARLGDRPMAVNVQKKVAFNYEVECMEVPSLEHLEKKKDELWWQQDDFDQFLQVRVDIAKAYKEAAQKLGVEFNSVCSVGVNSFEGYQAMRQACPRLKDESRRGLGLGRKRARAKNRVAYITAVTKEQMRQHDLGIIDVEAMARVASRYSIKDQQYAHFLAQTYYEQDRADEERERAAAEIEEDLLGPPEEQKPSKDKSSRRASNQSTLSREDDSPTKFWTFSKFKELLVDSTTEAPPSPQSTSRRSASGAKGFGLSKLQLQAAGLSATGHALLKSRSADDSHDSEMSGAESEAATDLD